MQSPPDLPNSSASRYEWSTIRRVELTESGKSSLGLIEKFQRDSHSWHASHFLPQDASLVTNFPNMCDKILNESKVCNYRSILRHGVISFRLGTERRNCLAMKAKEKGHDRRKAQLFQCKSKRSGCY